MTSRNAPAAALWMTALLAPGCDEATSTSEIVVHDAGPPADAAIDYPCDSDGVEVLAYDQDGVSSIETERRHEADQEFIDVYWTASPGLVMKGRIMPDGEVPVWPASHSASPGALTHDNDTLYWTERQQGVVGQSYKFGDRSTTYLATKLDHPTSVIADGMYIYWAHSDNGLLMRVAKTGGEPELIASEQGRIEGWRSLAQDDFHLYWTRPEHGAVMKWHKFAGTAPEVLADGLGAPDAIALDADFIYWTNPQPSRDGQIWRMPRGGGTPVAIAQHLEDPNALAVDDRYVYFTTSQDGALMRVVKAGGEAETIHQTIQGGGDVVLDDEFVYWTHSQCDMVFRISKGPL